MNTQVTTSLPTELAVESWNREYSSLQVIPSSLRTSAAKVFTLFRDQANFDSPGFALDAGCGNGRNSIYLADMGWNVTAIDASTAAVRLAVAAAEQRGLIESLHIREEVLEGQWSFEEQVFDLVLDSYVLCHYSDNGFIANHRNEMARVVKPSGFVFSAFFSLDDEYYQKVGEIFDPTCNLVRDPNNRINKRLYSASELKALFSERFNIKAFVDLRFEDVCLGQTYERSIFGLLLQTH